MIIKRRMFIVTIDDDINYKIIADSIDEAIAIMRKWRTNCNIISIHKMDDVVLMKEDVGL